MTAVTDPLRRLLADMIAGVSAGDVTADEALTAAGYLAERGAQLPSGADR
jgi:hypothetical protein